jgi:hypothetical protein
MRLSEMIKSDPKPDISELSTWGVQIILGLTEMLEDAIGDIDSVADPHPELWAISTSMKCICSEMEEFIKGKAEQENLKRG